MTVGNVQGLENRDVFAVTPGDGDGETSQGYVTIFYKSNIHSYPRNCQPLLHDSDELKSSLIPLRSEVKERGELRFEYSSGQSFWFRFIYLLALRI